MPLTLKLLSKSRNYANTKAENYLAVNNSKSGFQRTLNAHMDLSGYVVSESKTLGRSTIRHQNQSSSDSQVCPPANKAKPLVDRHFTQRDHHLVKLVIPFDSDDFVQSDCDCTHCSIKRCFEISRIF